MSLEKYTIDELIDQSLKLKAEIAKLRAKRIEIKNEIARRNAVGSIERKMASLSDKEKEILKGSSNVVVTPKPAVLKVKN